MLSRIMNVDPINEMRAMEDTFNRMFGYPVSGSFDRNLQVSTLPVDIFEKDDQLVVRAAVPGIDPKDLDVSIDNNILTIKGETHSNIETGDKNAKVYRREVSYGAFSRSIRLPETVQVDKADAEFKHGFVTISIPKVPELKSSPKKLSVRSGEQTSNKQIETTPEKKASVK